MQHLLGIHWIATTHGTWLHGDPRGSWHQGKLIGPDPFLESAIQRRMTRDAVVLSDEECNLVTETIQKICADQDHTIITMAVEPTHTHVLFAPMKEPIKTVVARLKRGASMAVLHSRRAASDQDGRAMVPRSLWTARRFVVFIDDPQHLKNSMGYVERHAGGMVVTID